MKRRGEPAIQLVSSATTSRIVPEISRKARNLSANLNVASLEDRLELGRRARLMFFNLPSTRLEVEMRGALAYRGASGQREAFCVPGPSALAGPVSGASRGALDIAD